MTASRPGAPLFPGTDPPAARQALPLERKLPLLILGLLTLVLGIAVVSSYYRVRASAEATARQRLTNLSQVVGSMVQQQLAARIDGMRAVAADSAVVNALRTPLRAPSRAAHEAVAAILTPADRLSPVLLLTPAGQPLNGARLETAADVERLVAHLPPATTDSGLIGALNLANDQTTFWISVPVHDHGSVIGYVAQERHFNTNPHALQPFHDLIGADIEMYVRNASDSTWVRLDGRGVATPSVQPTPADSVVELRHGPGGRMLASTAAVRGTPFLVTVEYPMTRVLAAPRATARTLAFVAMLLALLGALLAWGISRQMTRPLVELTRAAETMAAGEYSHRVQPHGHDEIGRLGAAFNVMAQRIERSSIDSDEAVARLTRSAATQEFLAEASRLLAESLSDETLLADLARYCVPSLADYCTIQVLNPDGTIRRVETAHHDRAMAEPVRALVRRFEYRIDGPGEVPEVIRTQKPILLPALDREAVRAAAPDDEARALIDVIDPKAFMCVPLVARGHSLGAMAFTMTDSNRSFSHDDLDLAMELARRTAVAIDNTMIYRRSVSLRMEAEAASHAKSDFLAKMSHEIRTPINAMMGYADLLEMGISGPITDGQAKYLSRIRASGDHLTSLVGEILDLAKIEAGSMAVTPTRGDSLAAVDASLALIRPQANLQGLNVLTIPPATAAGTEYFGDAQRVQQILTNLLANAVKFTPRGGNITVRWGAGQPQFAPSDSAADATFISVEDRGIGIDPTDHERIFHPFIQVEDGYTRAHGGTGLGLTISRTLARMMDGDLVVTSALGQGARFTLWLPSPD